ncbi:MAG: hypothetical protein JZU49_04440, partial [Sulfuricurvum sp.]|nr:hypothetical protein [Sulfuricurvum sp.]
RAIFLGAPDAGDSGAIPSLFLRLILFPVGQRSAARPSAGNANRWAFSSQPITILHVYLKGKYVY